MSESQDRNWAEKYNSMAASTLQLMSTSSYLAYFFGHVIRFNVVLTVFFFKLAHSLWKENLKVNDKVRKWTALLFYKYEIEIYAL